MFRPVIASTGISVLCVLLGSATAAPQESADQADALALLTKIDGKVKFDSAHPKRVIAVDI